MKASHYSAVVVDDEESMREYVRHILENNGFEVFEAKNGNECMAIIRANRPDLIVTDIVMPDKEGLETIRTIKSEFPECAIITMSGADNSETYLFMAQRFGAHAKLKKPFTKQEMEAVVHSTMEFMQLQRKK